MSEHKRIFLTGSTQFWLNAFADSSQVGGGFGQGIVNDEIPVVHYGIPWMIGDGYRADCLAIREGIRGGWRRFRFQI